MVRAVLILASLAATSALKLAGAGDSACSFYVAPSGVNMSGAVTLADAPDLLRERLRTTAGADTTVCLLQGTHHVPLGGLRINGAEHTPAAGSRVVWRGLGAGVRVTGGAQVTGWTQVSVGGGNAWAWAAPVPAALPQGAVVRNLWVADTRANRTVLSDPSSVLGDMTMWASADGTTAGFTVSKGVPAAWTADGDANLQQIEFAWPIAIRNWISPMCTVASVDGSGNNITLASPCSGFLLNRASGKIPAPAAVTAVPAFPLQPGTFYHNVSGGMLLYALAAGQSPSDLESSAWIGVSDVLIALNGTSGHSWQGLDFQYSAWQQVNMPGGYVDDQSAIYACAPNNTHASRAGSPAARPAGSYSGIAEAACEPLGAVQVLATSTISFLNCSFMHMGTVYALSITGGSTLATVSGNAFSDLSGGFLKLGNVESSNAMQPDPSLWDGHSVVSGNVARYMALEYSGAAALFAGWVVNSTFSQNTITDTGYSGMSLGWGWGAPPLPTGMGNNTVTQNYFARIMRTLRDGGGIYTNGHSCNSSISGNYVQQDEAVFAVYYMDNGATGYTVTNNVADASPLAWASFQQGCCNLPALDTHVSNLWYANALAPQNNCVAEGCTLDSSTVYNVTGAAWPPAAQAIIDAAGAPGAGPSVVL